MGREFELISYSVNGLGDEKKRKKIFNYLKKNCSGNSIIFLQETYPASKIENSINISGIEI